jgi:hypothetical protein
MERIVLLVRRLRLVDVGTRCDGIVDRVGSRLPAGGRLGLRLLDRRRRNGRGLGWLGDWSLGAGS